MNFKEALHKISTWNYADNLEVTRQKWIYDLILEIKQFLESSQKDDFALIIETRPELGQLIALLSKDEIVMTDPGLFKLFLDNLLWFYRPTSTVLLETRASEWAGKLFRSMVVFPKTNVLEICPNVNLRSCRLSTETLTQTLQRLVCNHLRQRTYTNVQSFRRLARDCSVLLRNKHSLDIESLQNIINILPSVCSKLCPDEVHSFYRSLDKELTSESSDLPEILHEHLSEKYPLHVENEVVKLVCQWVNKGKNLNIEMSSSWLISAASRNKRVFRTSLSIWNSIFAKTGSDPTIAKFIHGFLRAIRIAREMDFEEGNSVNSLAQLYPEHLSSLVYLLEMDTADLDDQLKEQHSLFLANTITDAIADHRVSQREVAFLLLQFPRWWNCIQQLEKHPDQLVHTQFDIFWNMLRGTCYIQPR